jgi:hypothetical protein
VSRLERSRKNYVLLMNSDLPKVTSVTRRFLVALLLLDQKIGHDEGYLCDIVKTNGKREKLATYFCG